MLFVVSWNKMVSRSIGPKGFRLLKALWLILMWLLFVTLLWVCIGAVFYFALLWNNHSGEAGLSSKSCSSTQPSQSPTPPVHQHWTMEDDSGSDSDADRPDPDLVLDDLASRRFHSPSPTTPTNFAVPASPGGMGSAPGVKGCPWAKVTMTPSAPLQNVTYHRSENMKQVCDVPAWWEQSRLFFSPSVCQSFRF